jgi:hypothetical protein
VREQRLPSAKHASINNHPSPRSLLELS